MSVVIKRAYEKPGSRDGYRVLVDALWPRGVRKEALKAAEWMRGIAPSAALRKWYSHEPEKWEKFRLRYRREMSASPRKELLAELVARARKGKVTLVFAARDGARSNAAAIAELIREKI